jgi:hypothetical protein
VNVTCCKCDGTIFQVPNTSQEWEKIADDFNRLWQFPNCIGAIDGKLVHIQRPVRSGSTYFNYKRTFSVNMMAVVDSKYRFLYVTVGAQGSANDAAVFNASTFGNLISESSNPLHIPPERYISGTNIKTPLMFIADEAYPLRPNIMKPFSSRRLCASERIFNYRLSRARRVVENSFGILVNRFRIFRHAIQLPPEKVSDMVMAACALHNFLRDRSVPAGDETLENGTVNESMGHEPLVSHIQHIPRAKGAHYNSASKAIRDTLAHYFVSEGQLSWQWKHGNVQVTEENDSD